MESKFKYKAKGLVIGNYWGGGNGVYATINFTADTRDYLNEKISNSFKDGSIDSGMGYESLIGALLSVTEIETITINDKDYIHKEYDLEMVGDMNDKQREFMFDAIDRI